MVNIKPVIERLYIGVCTVIEHQKRFNETTKQTEFEDVEILTDQPCRLSYSTLTQNFEENFAGSTAQIIKLFLDPNINIPAGCKILVTQNGKTVAYTASGEPALYQSHQEIKLKLFEKWA